MTGWDDVRAELAAAAEVPGRPADQVPQVRVTCPWPRCRRDIRPDHLMCRSHWYLLPAALRRRVLAAYVPGQTALTASPEYLEARADALAFAEEASQ
jgi:hypothetical protein